MNHQAYFAPVPIGAKNSGITIHDWMAAAAMQGFINRGMAIQADRAMTEDEKDFEMAERAYKMADAMLLARASAEAAREKQAASLIPAAVSETGRAESASKPSDVAQPTAGDISSVRR